MTSFVLTPQMKAMILRAKEQGGSAGCDPRAMYPMGHKCAATTSPVTGKIQPPWITRTPILIDRGGVPIPPDAKITKSVPLTNGQAVTDIETKDGDSVTAVTDPAGNVQSVEVKNKWLVPAALAAAFFILGG